MARRSMHGAESRTANENSAYVFLRFNIRLSLLFPILVSSLVLYVVLALIFSILFNIRFSLYEVVVLFCICRVRTSFLCFLSGVVFVLCLSLFSVNFPSFNQYLLLPSLLLYVCPILSEYRWIIQKDYLPRTDRIAEHIFGLSLGPKKDRLPHFSFISHTKLDLRNTKTDDVRNTATKTHFTLSLRSVWYKTTSLPRYADAERTSIRMKATK